MMYAHSGKGWLVPLLLLGCPFGVYWAVERINGPMATRPDGSLAHVWPILLGLVLAGMILFACGLYLNSRPPTRALEQMTGRVVLVRPRHTAYGIKVEYWGLVSMAGAILVFWFRGL